MTNAVPCVIDTNVLHHANRRLSDTDLRAKRDLKRRLDLLLEIREMRRTLLVSRAVLAEYTTHLRPPYNDYVQAFLAIATGGSSQVSFNWTTLSGSQRDRALKTCRFPKEDLFLLRTACNTRPAVIFSEERRVTATDRCVHRHFRVHVTDPTE